MSTIRRAPDRRVARRGGWQGKPRADSGTMRTARRSNRQLGRRTSTLFSRLHWLATLFMLTVGLMANATEPSGMWRVSHGEDRITRVRAWLATSASARAQDLMGNSLQSTDSWIGFFCYEGREGVFLAFSRAPDLLRGRGAGSRGRWQVRTRWDEEVHRLDLHATSDGTIFAFETASDLVPLLTGSNSALVELPWQGPDFVYFVYPIADTGIEFKRESCRVGPFVRFPLRCLRGSVREGGVPRLPRTFVRARSSDRGPRLRCVAMPPACSGP